MKILDLSAGNRAIWFNKNHPLAVFLDERPGVEPTIVCNTNSIPPEAGSDFDLVVFDPPHMCCGPKSNMAKLYGYHTTKRILETIEKTSLEAHRITKPDALMALKWNDHDIKLSRVFALMPKWEPLFGHSVSTRTKHSSQTFWALLRRLK